ncbi:MAG: hypothetical protein HUU21_23690 [Polyangiaceae bacterium]|nr:hypothetical protein [Polyangiaceae bacterium]NUQ76554.1 hypothetical protein [Polyangiaceae bacterium]
MMRRALIAGLALACGCTDDPIVDLGKGPLRGELEVDIRDRADVEIRGEGAELEAMVKLSKGYGLLPEGAMLVGKGREEAFPEAKMTLYTARFDAPPAEGGPCKSLPVSLALSISMREGPRAAGSLTAYCGAGVFYGEPARVLRLSGNLVR